MVHQFNFINFVRIITVGSIIGLMVRRDVPVNAMGLLVSISAGTYPHQQNRLEMGILLVREEMIFNVQLVPMKHLGAMTLLTNLPVRSERLHRVLERL